MGPIGLATKEIELVRIDFFVRIERHQDMQARDEAVEIYSDGLEFLQ